MANKTKFNRGTPFKLQVYVDENTVDKIDRICLQQDIYRSGFVTEAINKLLGMSKYRKMLGNK